MHPAARDYHAQENARMARNRLLTVAGAILFVLALLVGPPLIDMWNGR